MIYSTPINALYLSGKGVWKFLVTNDMVWFPVSNRYCLVSGRMPMVTSLTVLSKGKTGRSKQQKKPS